MNEYGPLTQLVSSAGSIMAAAGAIILSFKGRARWEPSEEDIPKGPQKVAGLAVAVVIAVLTTTARPERQGMLASLAVASAAASVLFLLVYGYLVGLHTYKKVLVVDATNGRTVDSKIIGGFRLTENARETIEKQRVTVQRFLEGVAYDPDEVWTRPSRVIIKQLFVAAYIGLIGFGAVGLSAASLLLGLGV